MIIPVYEYDGVPFERVNEKWICKGIAMRGPTGNMFNKEVPEVYAKPIEQAYQALLNSKEKDLKIRLIGRRTEGFDEIQEIDPMEKKIEKLKKKMERAEEKAEEKKKVLKKEPTEKTIKKVKRSLVGGFNPFSK